MAKYYDCTKLVDGSSMDEKKEHVLKEQGLVNTILEYVIENKMSFKELLSCVDTVKDVYCSDGLINSK